ncbi:hypothetical protein SXCC_04614 [Gluconacetobacter sp. SXCC-1]|nr:hypothetical protein SXCC_04614 [Gluconacetobacter sp. SXCC-1]
MIAASRPRPKAAWTMPAAIRKRPVKLYRAGYRERRLYLKRRPRNVFLFPVGKLFQAIA